MPVNISRDRTGLSNGHAQPFARRTPGTDTVKPGGSHSAIRLEAIASRNKEKEHKEEERSSRVICKCQVVQ